MTWTVISDATLTSGKPNKASTMRKLRDNIAAFANGDAGAPQMNRAAISPGSSGKDGSWVNATAVTGLGYFEPQDILFTAPRALPSISIIRVNGNVAISDVVTLDGISQADSDSGAFHLGAGVAAKGSDGGVGVIGGGGAGTFGSGSPGLGTPGVGLPDTNFRWDWLSMRPLVGGRGGNAENNVTPPTYSGGLGGGFLLMIINGNLDMTGGTLDVSGKAGPNNNGGVAHGAGGGGGGRGIIVCAGTITNGTYKAHGGQCGIDNVNGGAGGGGRFSLIASAYAGAQTFDVAGGLGQGGSAAGAAGASDVLTLTQAQINSLLLRSY